MVTSAELTQKVRLNHTKYCLMQLMPKKNFVTQTSTIAKKKKSAKPCCPCCYLWFIFWHFCPLHLSLPALMSPYLAWHTGLPPAGQSEKPSWSLYPQSRNDVGRHIAVRFYTGTVFTLTSSDYSNLGFGEGWHIWCDQRWVCLCGGIYYEAPSNNFFLHLIWIQSFLSKAYSCWWCLHC